MAGRQSNLHSQTLGQERGENGVYTHSFNWDNSTTSCDVDMTRYSTERSAQVPELGGIARGPFALLGALYFRFPIWRATPPGRDAG